MNRKSVKYQEINWLVDKEIKRLESYKLLIAEESLNNTSLMQNSTFKMEVLRHKIKCYSLEQSLLSRT